MNYRLSPHRQTPDLRRRLSPRLSFLSLSLLLAAAVQTEAKVVRTSAFPNYAAALATLQSGDALLCDSPNSAATPLGNPPDNVQIIGGSATWRTTGDVKNVVFFKHRGLFEQQSGVFRKCLFFYPSPNSRFTGLDSCLLMGRDGTGQDLFPADKEIPSLLVEGYLRGTSIVEYITGSSASNDTHLGNHFRTMVFNATHPEGDGRGTLIANYIHWGQTDWTNVHVVNARGLTLAHFNSEYGRWSDPLAIIENGYECAILHMNPGGYNISGAYTNPVTLNDGRTIYPNKSYAGALFKVGGQRNSMIAGADYLDFGFGFRPQLGHYQPAYQIRDPFFEKWAPLAYDAVNLAPAKRYFRFFQGDRIGTPGKAWITNEAARCTTAWVDVQGNLAPGGLKPNSLPPGPKLHSFHFPALPKLLAGLGDDMTGKPIAEIEAALIAKKTVYLGKGTYKFTKTVKSGSIFGAGMDETVLEFPADIRALEDGPGGIYNLTVQGGKLGYAQTDGPNVLDMALVRFKGQTISAITLGNAQNVRFHNLEFDGTGIGVTSCKDGIPCGETPTQGGAMIDKVHFYNCSFKNMGAGINLSINLNGFTSFYGCHFENLTSGIFINASGRKNKGHHISSSTFKNCDNAINAGSDVFVDNCKIEGKGASSSGIIGNIMGAINCTINNVGQALVVSGNAVVHNVQSTGTLQFTPTTWISGSRFTNIAAGKTFYGSTDISTYVDNSEIAPDRTAPSAPLNVTVKRVGNDNYVSWLASEDTESGVLQYIVERDYGASGLERGRTPLNWKIGDTRPTAHDPRRTSFLDLGAPADQKYRVHALNGAYIRSDNKMGRLRLWEPYDSGDADSVYTNPGRLGKYFAVDFSGGRQYPTSMPGDLQNRFARENSKGIPVARFSAVEVWTLQGRRLGAVPASKIRDRHALKKAFGLEPGMVLIRQPETGATFRLLLP